MLLAPDQVAPVDRRIVVELEAPVRADALPFQRRPLLVGQAQCRTVVDRGQAAPGQDLPLEIKLFGGFVAGINLTSRAQFFKARFVKREPIGLADRPIWIESKPGEISPDRLSELCRRSFEIGIVQPQQEAPAILPRPQPVVERRADIADVQPAGR